MLVSALNRLRQRQKMADYYITLGTDGPSPKLLPASQEKTVGIINATGDEVTLTADKGLFVPMPKGGVKISDGATKDLRLGRNIGTYKYDYGGPGGALGVRTGRINI